MLVAAAVLEGGSGLRWVVHAQQEPGWLRVVTGDGRCIEADDLLPHVRRYLVGGAPSDAVAIEVRAGARTVAFSVVQRGEVTARRSFSSLPHACDARLDALGLAIALAIEGAGAGRARVPDADEATPAGDTAPGADDGATEAPSELDAADDSETNGDAGDAAPASTGEPQGPEAMESLPAVDATDGGDLPRPTEHDWSHGILLGAGGAVGMQPTLAPLLVVGYELRAGWLALEVAALWSPELEAIPEGLARGRIYTSVYGGRASACLGGDVAVVRAEGCAGLLSGVMVALGDGLERNENATLGFLASAVGVRARIPARTPLGLRLRVDLHQNLVQPTLVVAGTGGVRDPVGALGLVGFAEIHWALP